MAWSDKETEKLIQLWGEEDTQAQLEGCKRNIAVYEQISKDMKAAKFDRSAVQCREKMKKLRTLYKQVKDRNGLTGRGRYKMKFFDQLNEILGNRPATRPSTLLDTSDATGTSPTLAAHHSPPTLDCQITDSDELGEPLDHSGEKAEEGKAEGKEEQKVKVERKKPKRPTREEFFEQAIVVAMEKAMKMNEASERKFLELEEKRLKMEERMMEIELQQSRQRNDLQLRVCFNKFKNVLLAIS